VLLKLTEQWPVEQICQAFDVGPGTVYNTLARYREGGVERVLHDGVQVNRRHALTSDEEALLLALTCSPVPDDHDHWTLRLLQKIGQKAPDFSRGMNGPNICRFLACVRE
jgi:transposase